MTTNGTFRSGRAALSAAFALAIGLPAASQSLPPARMPTDAEMAAAMAANRDQMPVLELPAGAGSQIDIQAIAAQAERATGLGAGERHQDSASRSVAGLMIFVSLSMPHATLQALVEQAERAHAQLVLRGLKDRSIRKTAEAVRAMLGNRRVAWTIDPQAFERFAVAAVPTYVLVDPRQPATVGCDGGQCGPMAFSKLTGDVSIDYALRNMEREDPPFAALARRHLAAMRGMR